MNFRKHIMGAIAWSATNIWASYLISFLVILVLSRLLEPKAFGLVALATVFTFFINIFRNQGFSEAIIQRADIEPEHLYTAFWAGLLNGVLLMVCTIAGSGLIAKFFNESQLEPVISWLSLSFVFVALGRIQDAILRRNLVFKKLTIASLFSSVAGGLIGILMAFRGFGVWSLVGQVLLKDLIYSVFLWKVTDWRPQFKFSKRHFKELFVFGLNIVGINLLEFLNRRSNHLFIGYFLGSEMLGYYTIAHRLLQTLIKLLISISRAVAFPLFSRLQTESERMRRAFYKIIQVTNLIIFPVFLALPVIAPELVPFLFGPKWDPSIPVVQALAFMGIISSISYLNGSLINASGKPSWYFIIMFLSAVSNIIALFIVIKEGIVAVAAAYVIVGFAFSPISIWAIHKLIGINLKTYLKQYIIPLSGSLVMVAVIWILKYEIAGKFGIKLELFSCIFLGMLVYILFVFFVARSRLQEMLEFIRLVLPLNKFRTKKMSK